MFIPHIFYIDGDFFTSSASSSSARSGSDPHFKVPHLPSVRTENFPHRNAGSHQCSHFFPANYISILTPLFLARGPTPPFTSRLSRHDGNFTTKSREQTTERRPVRIHVQRSSIPQQSRDQPQHDRQWASSSSVPIAPSGVRDDDHPIPSHFAASSAASSKLTNSLQTPIPMQPIPHASNRESLFQSVLLCYVLIFAHFIQPLPRVLSGGMILALKTRAFAQHSLQVNPPRFRADKSCLPFRCLSH